jgi:hypothetical protein
MVGVVIVGDNMERKSMSYYRKRALFDNNDDSSLKHETTIIASLSTRIIQLE